MCISLSVVIKCEWGLISFQIAAEKYFTNNAGCKRSHIFALN